jgi:hypothetical protein
MRFRVFTFLFVLALAGCQSKASKVAELQTQYTAAYAAYTKDCQTAGGSSGAARLLTGEKLSQAQFAELEAKRKAQEARCKPQAEHLADIQRQILAAQQ